MRRLQSVRIQGIQVEVLQGDGRDGPGVGDQRQRLNLRWRNGAQRQLRMCAARSDLHRRLYAKSGVHVGRGQARAGHANQRRFPDFAAELS